MIARRTAVKKDLLADEGCYVFRYFRISEASYPAFRWRDYGKQFLDKLGQLGG